MDTDMTTNSTRRMTIHHYHCPTCQSIIIVSLYAPTQSYITINNSRRRRVANNIINLCTVLIVRQYNIQLIVHGKYFCKVDTTTDNTDDDTDNDTDDDNN